MRKNKENICSEKLARALADGNRDFWREVGKVKHKPRSTACVDGKTNAADVANAFGEKFKSLYNSVGFDKEEMLSLMKDNESEIRRRCIRRMCDQSHCISLAEVEVAVGKLKRNKYDGDLRHCTNHIIHGPRRLSLYIALLFSGMLRHGFTPEGFRISTVIPIPKNKKKSLNNSENYRGIALSSILGKLFDCVVLDQHERDLLSSDLQFGFKAEHSTSMCSFAVKEVMQYYINKNQGVCAVT